jgi:hypothetical protein
LIPKQFFRSQTLPHALAWGNFEHVLRKNDIILQDCKANHRPPYRHSLPMRAILLVMEIITDDILTDRLSDVQRREIQCTARTIAGWLAGIVNCVESANLHRTDVALLHRELILIERRLERFTTDVILDR